MPIVFPNCKINLGLNITSKRQDGYHNLETVFYPIPLNDALEITSTTDMFSFSQSGIKIEDEAKNLCVKAYNILKRDFPSLPAVNIHLLKAIPIGAGLGGGSADAAFTLKLLNNYFKLNLSESNLKRYAATLGSDCAFFLLNKPCFASGRGELLKEIDLNLSGYTIILINPGINISTVDAFSKVISAQPLNSLADIIQEEPQYWKEFLTNDFELSVFSRYPEIQKIKEQLYKLGAVYASLSGSGSSVFGLFEKGSVFSPTNIEGQYVKIMEML